MCTATSSRTRRSEYTVRLFVVLNGLLVLWSALAQLRKSVERERRHLAPRRETARRRGAAAAEPARRARRDSFLLPLCLPSMRVARANIEHVTYRLSKLSRTRQCVTFFTVLNYLVVLAWTF